GGEEVGLSAPRRQVLRPACLEYREFAGDLIGQARRNLMGARRRGLVQSPPSRNRQVVGARPSVMGAGQVHARHGLAQQLTLSRRRSARPHAVEEADDRRRPPAQLAERRARALVDRRRADEALGREMLHEPEEERQVGARDTLLVEGEDIAAAIGREQEVAVLDAFGNALAGHGAADVVEGDEVLEIAVRDFRVDGHEARSQESDQAVSALGSLKCTLSSMTASSSMVTAKRSRQAAITSCTSTSGAEAPAVM